MAEQLLHEDQQTRPYHKTGRGNTRLTYEQYKEAKRCYEILCATPKMNQLAKQWGIRRETLVATIRRGIKQYDQRAANEGKT